MEMVFGSIGFGIFCAVILICVIKWASSPVSGGSGKAVNWGKCRVCKMALTTYYPGGVHPDCYPSRKGRV